MLSEQGESLEDIDSTKYLLSASPERPFHASVACSRGCPLQRIRACISCSSLLMLHFAGCLRLWIMSPFGLQPGKGVSSDAGLPFGNGRLSRGSKVLQAFHAWQTLRIRVRGVLLPSVRRQESALTMTLQTSALILKAQGLASTGA